MVLLVWNTKLSDTLSKTDNALQKVISPVFFGNSVQFDGGLIPSTISGISTTNSIIFIPNIRYNQISADTTSEDYFKKFLQYICQKYPNRQNTLFIGSATPNATGFVLFYIYDTNDINNEGNPKYSGGFNITVNSDISVFGCNNYNYFYRVK